MTGSHDSRRPPSRRNEAHDRRRSRPLTRAPSSASSRSTRVPRPSSPTSSIRRGWCAGWAGPPSSTRRRAARSASTTTAPTSRAGPTSRSTRRGASVLHLGLGSARRLRRRPGASTVEVTLDARRRHGHPRAAAAHGPCRRGGRGPRRRLGPVPTEPGRGCHERLIHARRATREGSGRVSRARRPGRGARARSTRSRAAARAASPSAAITSSGRPVPSSGWKRVLAHTSVRGGSPSDPQVDRGPAAAGRTDRPAALHPLARDRSRGEEPATAASSPSACLTVQPVAEVDAIVGGRDPTGERRAGRARRRTGRRGASPPAVRRPAPPAPARRPALGQHEVEQLASAAMPIAQRRPEARPSDRVAGRGPVERQAGRLERLRARPRRRRAAR